METVLVTGGCGYIGSHTCVCLVKKGFNIVIIDSLVNSYKSSYLKILEILRNEDNELINMIKFHEGDLRDIKFLSAIFANQKANHWEYILPYLFDNDKSNTDCLLKLKYRTNHLGQIMMLH